MRIFFHSLNFRRFVWFLIVVFSFFSTPHVELVLPEIAHGVSSLFVSNAYADTTDTPILGRIVTDKVITHIAQAPNADVAYGINSVTKDVYIFDLVNYTIKSKITLSNTPVSVAVHPASGNAYVIQKGGLFSQNGFLSVVTPAGDIVSSTNLPSAAQGIAIDADANTAVVTFSTEKKVRLISTGTLEVVSEISLPTRPKLVALDPDSHRAVISVRETLLSLVDKGLVTVDLTTGTVLNTLHFDNGIRGIAVDTVKNLTVVVTFSTISIVNTDTGTVIASFPASFNIGDFLQQILSGDFSGGIPELYFGVDINQSTHMGVISSDNGFNIVNLNNNTIQTYSPEASEGMIALSVDMYRNSFLVSYIKIVSSAVEKGVLEIQLPNPVPILTSISPVSTLRGNDTLSLNITGDLFVTGSVASFYGSVLETNFVGNANLTASIPSSMLRDAGTFPIVVVNPEPLGGVSNELSFEVRNPLPVLTSLDPTSAIAGIQDITLNVYGSGFFYDSGIVVNNTSHASIYVSPTQLTTTLTQSELAQSGSLTFVVVNPLPGGGTSNPMDFSIINTTPVLTFVTPNSVTAGSPDVELTITGTNFIVSSTVTLNGASLLATVVNETTINATVPASRITTEGTYPIVVSNPSPGGGNSSAVNFTVTRAINVTPPPDGSFGKKYEDLIPSDATIESYDPKRFAIITGLVQDLSGNPFAGVSVNIHSKSEYGTAQTDTTGRFSLPLDGGGSPTIVYTKPGFITSHRQVNTPWNDIVNAETITMIPEDTTSTQITFDGSPSTVMTHTSTPYTDNRGVRSATIVFTGDNSAFIKNTDGTETQVSNITVRATEFVTPETMPAKLPPTSAYTYCAEFTVDGAKSVRFSNPVTIFVNNFLGFNVGTIVPVGYYDRDQTVWMASNNGVVVRLLDTNGDNTVDAYTDGTTQYPVSGLTNSARYVPDSTYWMVRQNHFSPWDYNFPYAPPPDAVPPNPEGVPEPDQQKDNDDINCTGSYCESRSRIFHEDIPIPGTDLSLHYMSSRTKGFKSVVTIPASGSTVPSSLKRIIVRMGIAGRVFETILPPLPNQKTEFAWDGLDYLGRPVVGPMNAEVSIGFAYQFVYYATSVSFGSAWARVGDTATGRLSREEIVLWKQNTLSLQGKTDNNLAEGWTLSAHHYMNPWSNGMLQKGNGTSIHNDTSIITTIAGNGQGAYSGDGGPATQAKITTPSDVVVDSAGNIYIADTGNHRIRKIDSNGIISTIAGNGQNTYSGDGGPATQASMSSPNGIVLDRNGNLYIVDYGNHRIRKVDTSGIITTIAGNGTRGFSGDGGPATQARFSYPCGIAIDNAGNIYVADADNHRIRRVDTSGIITTVAGNGQNTYSGDGGPATQASMHAYRVAADNKGNIFIADFYNGRVRKVDNSGIITTVAGNGQIGYSGDGSPAVLAGIEPYGVTVDSIGNLYLDEANYHRIRKVDTSGIITTIVGSGQSTYGGDGGPALQAGLVSPFKTTIDSAGSTYVADRSGNRIRKISRSSALYQYDLSGDALIADENGLGYIISSTGLHKSTIDLETGKTLLTFGYNGNNQLISITDRFGSATTIQRDISDKPLSITSSDGIVTGLAVDSSNHLAAITYPDSSSYFFTYSSDGLLTDKYEPKGNHFRHNYNANGTISNVSDPEGGSWDFSLNTDTSGNSNITISTAEGNTTTYSDRTDSTGAYTSLKTDPTGTMTTITRSNDELTETEAYCGMGSTSKYGLDSVYRFKHLVSSTVVTPAALTRAITNSKTYQDTNSDTIPDRITTATAINSKNWTTVNDTLTGTITATSPLGRTVNTVYNPANLLTQSVTIPGLLATSYSYDPRGRLTGTATGTRATSIAYNPQGFVDHIITPDNKTISYTYDEVGRVKTTTLPDMSIIGYDYDPNGNMMMLTNPKLIPYGFDYTGVNLRKTMTMPISGLYTYTYDKERNLKSLLFPSGKQIVNTYTNGQLSAQSTPEGIANYTYYCGDNIGSITKGTEAIAFTYDGTLLKTDTRAGLINQGISYGYNNEFKISSMMYVGISQSYTYDNDGLLTTAGPFTITRNAQNGLPASVSNGIFTNTRAFSGYGEIDGTSTTVNGANVAGYNITSRDQAGRITQKVETVGGVQNTFDYTYDDNGRLTEVKKNGIVAEAYTYDDNNNRLTEVNTLRGINRSYAVSDEDHLITTGSDTYQFDVDGFLTSKTSGPLTTTYQYSSRGELLTANLHNGNVITYDHDPMGRRIAKHINGVITEKYLWQGSTRLLALYDASDNLISRFTYSDDRMPMSMTYNGSTYYFTYDQVGSLRTVADASGNIVKRIDYDTFGNIIADTNPSITMPFGFAGGLQDVDTKLIRFGARDYDPAIGRWTAKDPIDFVGGDTNLYGYVANDPVNLTDREGLMIDPITAAVVCGAAIVIGGLNLAAFYLKPPKNDISQEPPEMAKYPRARVTGVPPGVGIRR